MAKFLTVKEAAKVNGKSASSIRRIIYPILEDDQHPDRHYIEPDVETAKALRMKGENFPWKISKELLDRVASEAGPKAKAEPRMNATGDDQSEVIIDILRKQLDIKDQQISAQNDVIKGLSERVREGNILMGSLQQQLSPPDTANRKKSNVVEADSALSKPKQGSDVQETPTKKTHWLFRKIF